MMENEAVRMENGAVGSASNSNNSDDVEVFVYTEGALVPADNVVRARVHPSVTHS